MHRLLTFLIFAVAVVAAMPARADVPSAASGVYLGSDRVCRIVLSRYQQHWIQTAVTCLGFDGRLSNALQTLYAPGTCAGTSASIPFDPQLRDEYLSIRSYFQHDQLLQIVRGPDQTAITNGIGTAEAWYRIGYAPSPSPYTCGGAAVSNKQRG